jgi:hypothetical protein
MGALRVWGLEAGQPNRRQHPSVSYSWQGDGCCFDAIGLYREKGKQTGDGRDSAKTYRIRRLVPGITCGGGVEYSFLAPPLRQARRVTPWPTWAGC